MTDTQQREEERDVKQAARAARAARTLDARQRHAARDTTRLYVAEPI